MPTPFRATLVVLAVALTIALTACLPPTEPVDDAPPSLVAARTGQHATFDRVVLELSGTLVPEVEVLVTAGAVREDGTGSIVAVAGDAAVVVRTSPAVGYDTTTWSPTYAGPHRLPVGERALEAVYVSDFEGVVTWAVGVADLADAERATVRTLTDPTRVVIDVPA